jgi:hypothetical protein
MTYMQSDDWRLCVKITKGQHAGEVLGPNIEKEEIEKEDFKHPGIDLAVLERLYDRERNATIFIASGTGTNGTAAAVFYLIRHWERLYREYKEDHFAVCLECPRRSLGNLHWAADEAVEECYSNSINRLEIPGK